MYLRVIKWKEKKKKKGILEGNEKLQKKMYLFLSTEEIEIKFRNKIGFLCYWTPSWAGVQKAGTAGTAGARQTTCVWTKWDLDEQIIEHIMKKAKMFCHTFE